MPASQKEVERILKTFTSDQRAIAETIAQLRIENRQYELSQSELSSQHADMYKILITILANHPKRELRIHDTQFLRFKDEYRIDRSYDENDNCVVLKLKALTDD